MTFALRILSLSTLVVVVACGDDSRSEDCSTGACPNGVHAIGVVASDLGGATVRACRDSACVTSKMKDDACIASSDTERTIGTLRCWRADENKLVVFLDAGSSQLFDGRIYSFEVTAADGTTLATASEKVTVRPPTSSCGCWETSSVELKAAR